MQWYVRESEQLLNGGRGDCIHRLILRSCTGAFCIVRGIACGGSSSSGSKDAEASSSTEAVTSVYPNSLSAHEDEAHRPLLHLCGFFAWSGNRSCGKTCGSRVS